jgi:hypothetical protein
MVPEFLGVAGFALAVVSLLINLALSWLKWPWPRIAVEVSPGVKIGVTLQLTPSGQPVQPQMRQQPSSSQPRADTFILRVINNGSETITIKSIGFTPGKRRGGVKVDLDALRAAGQGGVLPTLGGETAVFPARIEAHDCHIYEWDESALVPLTRGRNYYGYAERYKSFRWRPKCGRSLVRRTLSEGWLHRTES